MTTAGGGAGRRLAAILAADIAGYSALMGADEEGTVHALKQHQSAVLPLITKFNGRLIDTAGDGMLAEFASALNAIRCAVAIQSTMSERNSDVDPDRRLQYRIGVNLGDIVFDETRIYGDGINIAARLESISEPGGICISSKVHDEVVGKIGVDLVDAGEHTLKNIIRPVRVYRVSIGPGEASRTSLPVRPARSAPRLSVVVLPFTSRDEEQGYIAEGITEDVTTDLSRIPGSFIIARNTAFTYKDKPVDVRQIGRELGVRYVLQGSVRKQGDRLRMNASLVDAETGAQLWADRIDGEMARLGQVQDIMTSRLANALGVELVAAESQRALLERASNPDAVDLTMRGMALLRKPYDRPNHERARVLFDQALALDDGQLSALVGAAHIQATNVLFGWTSDPEKSSEVADGYLSKAIAINPNFGEAYLTRAQLFLGRGQPAKMLSAAQRAVSLNPNLAMAHFLMGLSKVYLGRSEESFADMHNALALSPNDPWIGVWLHGIGFAHMFLGNYEEAIEWEQKAIDANDRRWFPFASLAAALAMTGRVPEAQAAVDEARRANPQLTIAWLKKNKWSDSQAFLSQRERFYEGLRKAGLPEQ